MDIIDNGPNGSAAEDFSFLWFSMASQAFTFQERTSDRDCVIRLRVFRGVRSRKVLEGTYSSCFQMPPVSSLLLDFLLRLQRAMLEVTPVVCGAPIPRMPLDLATSVEIARESTEHWVLSYVAANDVRHTVRCKDGLLETKVNNAWEICATPRFRSVLAFIDGIIQRVTLLFSLEDDIDLRHVWAWRNDVSFMQRDEPPERLTARYAAIDGYLTRHPQAPLSEEEEDTESGEEEENNAPSEFCE